MVGFEFYFHYYVKMESLFFFYVRMKKDTFLKTTKVHYGFPGYMYNCIGIYLPKLIRIGNFNAVGQNTLKFRSSKGLRL